MALLTDGLINSIIKITPSGSFDAILRQEDSEWVFIYERILLWISLVLTYFYYVFEHIWAYIMYLST